jgi:hypothetical protein
MAKETWLTLGGNSSAVSTSDSPTSTTCDPRTAGRLATQLFGCYRASEANDPETYVTAAAALLSRYPEAVARQVCDPVRGLPSKAKWLPAIAEIREACERETIWHYAVVKRDREREHTARVLDGRKAAVGSTEHQRVVKGFAGLREAMEARRAPDPDRPKPFTLPVVEGKPLFADPPAVSTPELAKYLGAMAAYGEPADDTFPKFGGAPTS